MTFDGVKVKGRADRIDRLADGSLVIVDYKTGAPPTKPQVIAGYALQLGLLGLIAQHGRFADKDGGHVVTGNPTRFEYWSLGKAAKEVIAEAAEMLGGVERIVAWAKEAPENEKAFWSSIYPKLVPLDTYVSGPEGGPVQIANINVLPVSARVGSDG
jgi:RecB family exonuclease